MERVGERLKNSYKIIVMEYLIFKTVIKKTLYVQFIKKLRQRN